MKNETKNFIVNTIRARLNEDQNFIVEPNEQITEIKLIISYENSSTRIKIYNEQEN